MRLRVLDLPSRPVRDPEDSAIYAMGEPSYVLVIDEVDPEDRAAAEDLASGPVSTIRGATGARGVLVFRSRVDLPAVD